MRPEIFAAATQIGAGIIASVTLSLTIISGLLLHFTDKKTYPNIGDGLWWAIQTVTTVGYGAFGTRRGQGEAQPGPALRSAPPSLAGAV